MTVDEYVKPDGTKLLHAEAALFRGAVTAWKNRMDCRRCAKPGETLYMAIQNSYLTSIQSCPGLWDVWEDFNAKS